MKKLENIVAKAESVKTWVMGYVLAGFSLLDQVITKYNPDSISVWLDDINAQVAVIVGSVGAVVHLVVKAVKVKGK